MFFEKKEKKCYGKFVLARYLPALGPEGTARIAGIRRGKEIFLSSPAKPAEGHGVEFCFRKSQKLKR
jgi:hypothetical protein